MNIGEFIKACSVGFVMIVAAGCASYFLGKLADPYNGDEYMLPWLITTIALGISVTVCLYLGGIL